MYHVTAKSSEQEINAAIRHLDMREEAKDRVDFERCWGGPQGESILEYHILNQVCVLIDRNLGYALVNDISAPHKESEVFLDVTTPEQAQERWLDNQKSS
ncbi:hypothetical protein [Diaphorobacter sp. LR2014-1]|uniref:hypothetical protein n=1 Tax=Diaphorobacter sp. LR2014-1 TaxID=1933219 RepID=UPI000CDA235D|nr:hypothetical protein [Diaphorobacter sp. LR2014-1]POR07668.1 hypothetical protein BV908_19770 [Diaphorobacter sp. LR2014-1]